MISITGIGKPKELTGHQHNIILGWLGGLLKHNEDIKENKGLFGFEGGYKLLDYGLSRQVKNKIKGEVTLGTKAMAEYLMGKSITIPLIGGGKRKKELDSTTIKGLISRHYLYPLFKDKGTVGDNILYMWNDIMKNINIQIVDNRNIILYVGSKPMDMFSLNGKKFSFEYYLMMDKEKILKKEIELGYINKTIGDKNQGYAYTHLLRQNAYPYKIMTSVSIRSIMGWSKYNYYITSRKQGKTNFAADRVVAELLSDKHGYGSPIRRIKFFTDNATTVGEEMMGFIEEYLGDLKDMEIKSGVPYFTINKTKQEIVCNLTGNKFKVVSIYGLKKGSDTSKGDGMACDCAIIDEGYRIDKRFWVSFTDRAIDEVDWVLFISTFNEETETNHWAYDEMIIGDTNYDSEYNTVRSSIFDDTVTLNNNYLEEGDLLKLYKETVINKNKGPAFRKYENGLKEFTKSRWKMLEKRKEGSGEKYIMKRYLCSVLTDKKLFDISGRVIEEVKTLDSDMRVIGMDMGGLEDPLGVCVSNIVTLNIEKGYSKRLNDHNGCIEEAEMLKEKYPNCIIVGDLGGPVGQTVYLLDKNKVIDYWIKNGTEGITNKKGYVIIGKGMQIISADHALSSIFKVFNTCYDLIEQFGDMEGKKSKRSNLVLYKAKANRKDDAVFAFVLINSLLRIVWELITKEEIVSFGKDKVKYESASFEDEDDYYYNPMPY